MKIKAIMRRRIPGEVYQGLEVELEVDRREVIKQLMEYGPDDKDEAAELLGDIVLVEIDGEWSPVTFIRMTWDNEDPKPYTYEARFPGCRTEVSYTDTIRARELKIRGDYEG